MNFRCSLRRAAGGALAGLAGTVVIQLVESGLHRAAPSTAPKMRGDPGEYFVQTADQSLPDAVRQNIPDALENVASTSLGYLYGATFGALFGVLRPRSSSVLVDGAIMGLLCWAAGYLGWLPATKLMKPVWKQKPAEVAGPSATHAVYGVATVAAGQLIKHAMK